MKMIAVDLDGTLLNSESKISKENIDAIKKAREHGIEV
ncbi:HAD family hydrolase, partial [Bacillus haynesii]